MEQKATAPRPESKDANSDQRVIEGFGQEWQRFDQSTVNPDELAEIFKSYFEVFPWEHLPPDAQGFDLGCGSGRWASFVAKRVGHLHCIDPSERALSVARRNVGGQPNCTFHQSSVDRIPLHDASMDFGYSLGVLHHIPDTQAGIQACVRKLKPGAPFLLYLYYAFDNKPKWYQLLWRVTDLVRRLICRLPFDLKAGVCRLIALTVYYPLARTALLLERTGMDVSSLPLSAYRQWSFYTMSTDALDRFGTRLERRFTRDQIARMMRQAGLENITFGSRMFWCSVGTRSGADGLQTPSGENSRS
jgi:ubiquinone/menaquinone biosynthesis C-methylase UbiE